AIQRRDNGHWEPPGGVLEHGETIDECLHREVLEETGLNVEPERLTGIYQNMTRDVIALVYSCRITSGTIRTTEESQDFAWLTTEQITDRMDEAFAVRLIDARRDPALGPATRVHDGVELRA